MAEHNVAFRDSFVLKDAVTVVPGEEKGVDILHTDNARIRLFAFDTEEGLSSHMAPADAMITVLEGEIVLTLNDEEHTLMAGEAILLKKDDVHAISATTASKVMLVVAAG